MYVRSTRTIAKRDATEVAKQFYEELIVRLNRASESEVGRLDLAVVKKESPQHSFCAIAEKSLEAERGRMMRGELSLQSFKSLRNRFKNHLFPFFLNRDIRSVSHDDLSVFTASLVERGSSSITITQYLQSIRLVFKFALINNIVDKMPPFPKIKLSSQPRGGIYSVRVRAVIKGSQTASAFSERKKARHASR